MVMPKIVPFFYSRGGGEYMYYSNSGWGAWYVPLNSNAFEMKTCHFSSSISELIPEILSHFETAKNCNLFCWTSDVG